MQRAAAGDAAGEEGAAKAEVAESDEKAAVCDGEERFESADSADDKFDSPNFSHAVG